MAPSGAPYDVVGHAQSVITARLLYLFGLNGAKLEPVSSFAIDIGDRGPMTLTIDWEPWKVRGWTARRPFDIRNGII